MTGELVYAILTIAVIYGIGRIWYDLYVSPLSDVPGPFLARFTCLWEVLAVLRGKSHEEYIRLHKLHGSVVRVGPNRYSMNGSDAKNLYRQRLTKANYYDAFGDPSEPNMLSMRNDDDHLRRKRNFIRSYSMEAMKEYEGAINQQAKLLLQKLLVLDVENKPVPITYWLKLYTFGIITTVTIGEDFHGLSDGTDSTGILDAITAAVRYAAIFGLFPRLHHALVRVTSLFGLEPPIISLLKAAERAAGHYRNLRADISQETPHAPFLEQLFCLYDEDKVDFRAIHDCCSSNIAAGSDTTASTISAALYFLYHKPEQLAKLRAEIAEKLERDQRVKTDETMEDTKLITVADIQCMPYLESVVKEALRLHPAVGSMLPREVPAGGISVCGRHFPEGTVIGINPWAVHYNEAIYGSDCAEFRPERWMDQDNSPPAPLSFGVGVRQCIGKSLALVIASLTIAKFVENFDMEFDMTHENLGTQGAWFVEPSYSCQVRKREKWFCAKTVMGEDSAQP